MDTVLRIHGDVNVCIESSPAHFNSKLLSAMSEGSFMVSLNGQIVCLEVLAAAGSRWHCKYEFVYGADWRCVGGIQAGLSQIANVVQNGEKVVLNLPVEIVFRSTNPHGWPQIILSVYCDMQLAGYGRVHVPLQAGVHHLRAHLSKPIASSLLGYIGSFFGYQPELVRPTMIATTAGSNLIRMVSSGEVQLTLNVVTQHLQPLGYDVGNVNCSNINVM